MGQKNVVTLYTRNRLEKYVPWIRLLFIPLDFGEEPTVTLKVPSLFSEHSGVQCERENQNVSKK
ncbi:MAG: hypothetical protein ACTSUO_00450 [Candidatus Thorarchaeota archaeon]